MTRTANRVLVTGATGFLGSHCLAPLVERGFDVLALYRERAPLDVPGVQWVRGDVMDRGAMRGLLDEHKPKGLLHLAWFVEPGKLITDASNLSWVSASLDLIRAFREGRRRALHRQRVVLRIRLAVRLLRRGRYAVRARHAVRRGQG